ncbi:MAG: twin-arginine translocation signal domain-containing protein [Verrucomicrobiota bacterium]|nr:twin-arginine translocation signal domain-containing protein [Verrucomicrobiota bacterium]
MNRRTFIQTTGAAAAVAATTQLQAAEKKRERANQGLIFKSTKFGGRPNLGRMRKLKALGFDGIEGSAPGMDIAGLRKACAEVELPMHGVVYNKHWQKRLSSPDKAPRSRGRSVRVTSGPHPNMGQIHTCQPIRTIVRIFT